MAGFAVRFLAVAVMIVIDSRSVVACSCVTESIDEGLKSAVRVFLADVDSANRSVYDGQQVMVFSVSNVVVKKGGLVGFDAVRSPASGPACGKALRVPGKYWFFTDDNGLFSRCSATIDADDPRSRGLTESVWEKIVEQKREQILKLRKD